MKEFVEKLIERLEEKTRWVAYGNWDRDIGMTHKVVPFGDIKEIVNQLAEEFASGINVGSKNQDSTKNNQGWILVTERLPIEEGEVYPDVITTNKNGEVEVSFYNYHDKEWYRFDVYLEDYEVKKDVIAWQPLPEPYKLEEKPKFSNEELDAIMDKILDATQEESQPNFYTERFSRVI